MLSGDSCVKESNDRARSLYPGICFSYFLVSYSYILTVGVVLGLMFEFELVVVLYANVFDYAYFRLSVGLTVYVCAHVCICVLGLPLFYPDG